MRKKNNKLLLTKLNKNKKYIEKELKKILSDIITPNVLKKVMLYSVLNGGKRIRPFIISEISSLYQVKPSVFKYPAMAIEMAHSFSLIYDDLPCMDDDDLRRGKPSVHIKFDEANALLGGASLLTYAYNILASKKFIIDDKKKIAILKIFSNAIGHEGMLAGQFLDLEAEKPSKKPTIKKFYNIQAKKTGLLLAFCCYVGGFMGDASKKELEILFEFGLILGQIFQITDDILDKEGNPKLLGKKVNKDEIQNKATLIKIKGLKFTKNHLTILSLKAKEKLVFLNKDTKVLSNLIDFLCYRNS